MMIISADFTILGMATSLVIEKDLAGGEEVTSYN